MDHALAVWPVILVAGAGLVAWGDLRARVSGLRKDVDAKASQELVSHQYDEIIARLDRIEKQRTSDD